MAGEVHSRTGNAAILRNRVDKLNSATMRPFGLKLKRYPMSCRTTDRVPTDP